MRTCSSLIHRLCCRCGRPSTACHAHASRPNPLFLVGDLFVCFLHLAYPSICLPRASHCMAAQAREKKRSRKRTLSCFVEAAPLTDSPPPLFECGSSFFFCPPPPLSFLFFPLHLSRARTTTRISRRSAELCSTAASNGRSSFYSPSLPHTGTSNSVLCCSATRHWSGGAVYRFTLSCGGSLFL